VVVVVSSPSVGVVVVVSSPSVGVVVVVSSPSVGIVVSVGVVVVVSSPSVGGVVFTRGGFPPSGNEEDVVAFAKLLLTEPALITLKIVKSKSPRTIRSFNIFL
jgi:hypothetical protein